MRQLHVPWGHSTLRMSSIRCLTSPNSIWLLSVVEHQSLDRELPVPMVVGTSATERYAHGWEFPHALK